MKKSRIAVRIHKSYLRLSMNISVKPLPRSEVKLVITLSAEQMQKFKHQAVQEIARQVKIPGFRPGNAPYDVLIQHVNESAIIGHSIDLALPKTYGEAILKENIQAVSRPKIKIIKDDPLEYEAVVAVYPEVKISGYDKLKIPYAELKVEEQEITEVLSGIQKRKATYQKVDRQAQKADRVEIDFEGFDEGGASLENTKSKNHPLIIGEGSLVKGFEDELIGMKAGEKKTFTVTFPKDYFHKPFQDKKVEFRVEMKQVQEVVLPEWNSEFIKSLLGEEKTLDELKTITRENLERDKQYQQKVHRENEFLEKIIGLTQVEVPEALIEEEIDGIIDEFKNELSERGIQLEKYLEQTKKELKDLRADRRKEAEKRLTLRFGLQQIFKQENIDATPEDLGKEIDHMVKLYPDNEHTKIRREYEADYLRVRLANKLKMDKLFERFLEK